MERDPELIRHVVICGRVQGVGYRAWTECNARALGLGGWVRNWRDGTVEALFCGAAGQVEKMLARSREGPPGAVALLWDSPSCQLAVTNRSINANVKKVLGARRRCGSCR